jgi:Domain of unknown function (DUF1905)/Bacteriocin-protection, YdeI or OmpD-Associated
MAKVVFQSRVGIRGINPYVLVEQQAAERLKKGWRRPMPVKLRVGGGETRWWSINLMPVGDGSFYLYLHGQIRRASGVSVGDPIEIELDFDGEYQPGPIHPMPPLFRRELRENPQAERGWSTLAPSRKKEILRYLAALKSPLAIERNIRRAIEVLAGAKLRFMARDWNVTS